MALIRHEPSFVLIKITGDNVEENWRGARKGAGRPLEKLVQGQGEK